MVYERAAIKWSSPLAKLNLQDLAISLTVFLIKTTRAYWTWDHYSHIDEQSPYHQLISNIY